MTENDANSRRSRAASSRPIYDVFSLTGTPPGVSPVTQALIHEKKVASILALMTQEEFVALVTYIRSKSGSTPIGIWQELDTRLAADLTQPYGHSLKTWDTIVDLAIPFDSVLGAILGDIIAPFSEIISAGKRPSIDESIKLVNDSLAAVDSRELAALANRIVDVINLFLLRFAGLKVNPDVPNSTLDTVVGIGVLLECVWDRANNANLLDTEYHRRIKDKVGATYDGE